jgi:hypothetical protein
VGRDGILRGVGNPAGRLPGRLRMRQERCSDCLNVSAILESSRFDLWRCIGAAPKMHNGDSGSRNGLPSMKSEALWRAGPTREKKRYKDHGHQYRDCEHVLCCHFL